MNEKQSAYLQSSVALPSRVREHHILLPQSEASTAICYRTWDTMTCYVKTDWQQTAAKAIGTDRKRSDGYLGQTRKKTNQR
jgi:hypothetical protein